MCVLDSEQLALPGGIGIDLRVRTLKPITKIDDRKGSDLERIR